MIFVNKTSNEEDICKKSSISSRTNSKQIDYFNKVNDKPWGK